MLVRKMDTLVLTPKKLTRLIVHTVNFCVVLGVLVAQHVFEGPPLIAQEQIKLANNTAISPIFNTVTLEANVAKQLSIEQKTKAFDEEIKRKYKTGIITEVDKGVKHIRITKYYQGQPVRINVIEVNSEINPDLQLTPAIASETLANKASISSIAKKNNSIVAINGTFFKPATGVPLGTLMINKKMYTGPIYNRVAMGIFDNKYDMARVQLDATLKSGLHSVKVDNINQPRMLSTYVIVYTREWRKFAPPSPKYGKQIAVKDNKVIEVSTSALAIPEDGFVIVAPEARLKDLLGAKNIRFDVATLPEWQGVNHIISGGPYLVKHGEVFVDMTEQKLASIGGRNPRSAIGYTADNNLILVTVDGRESSSVGMTLMELANFMKSIGCINAMNLDGGGSTVLYVNGQVVNQPQVKGGIALSNALTLNKTNSEIGYKD